MATTTRNFARQRQLCLQQQTELRTLLLDPAQSQTGMELFLALHSRLHAAQMTQSGEWSFEDEVLGGLSEEQMRFLPHNREHSIAWLLWHLTRCEDITLNLLVAGRSQVLLADGWRERMHIPDLDSGNAMDRTAVEKLSKRVDIPVLRAYRIAVGRRTQAIAAALEPDRLNDKMAPERVQRMWDEGAVIPGAREVADYWASRTVAGLLLMPASRHIIIHLNEALDIKRRLGKPSHPSA